MMKPWIVALALNLAIAGTSGLCDLSTSAHKIDCQSELDVVSSLKPMDKMVVVNKSGQCGAVY